MRSVSVSVTAPSADRACIPFSSSGVCLDSRHAHRVLSMKRNKNDRTMPAALPISSAWAGTARPASGRSMRSSCARYCSRGSSSCRRAGASRTSCAARSALGAMTSSTKGLRFMPRVIALRAAHDRLASARAGGVPCRDGEQMTS
jgi:hypothetical protein